MGVIYWVSSSSDPYQIVPDSVSVSDENIGRVAHVFEFIILTILASNAILSGKKPKLSAVIKTFLFSTSYAVFDELHQSIVPERAFQFIDLGLDLVGILLGIGIIVCMFPLSRRIKNKGEIS
jgi:VanZ family protein